MASLLRNRLKNVKLESFHNLSCRAISLSRNMNSKTKNNDEIKETVTLLNGRALTLSTGKYAKMANGSAVVQSEDTAVMVTAVSKDSYNSQDSFLPLTVEFRMKSAAAGRIPTNYLRRELGQSEREILTARLMDRSIRPLFPPNFSSEVQIMSNLLSADGINDPEVLCINAASMALSLSDIPWDGPVGAVRVGLIGDDLIINPTRQELQKSVMNLIVAGVKSSKVVMIEGSFNDLNLNTVVLSIKAGLKEVKKIVASIENITKICGKPKQEFKEKNIVEDFLKYLQLNHLDDLKNIFSDFTLNKQQRDSAVSSLRASVFKSFMNREDIKVVESDLNRTWNAFVKNVFRDLIFESDVRCDGRGLTELRDISCEVNLYKPLHGSSIFQRGQTQVLCTVALDSPQSAVKTDSYTVLTSGLKEKSFFLNYEFPGYATNEVKQGRGVSRREIGHGALAEKGLRPVVPADYPFCIRLTSEVLESNGSSSMASVCGGSMALLDAGVPISSMAGGVAMGLVTRCLPGEIEDYRILTDILGIEDYLGDMDFKIAGTKTGITALQADFKIPGITMDILQKVLADGHSAKRKIINKMKETISSPSVKEGNMPILETFEVPVQKRNLLLGPAWINVKKLFLQTGVQITHVEDTTFSAFAPNDAAMQEAYEVVQKLLDSKPEPQFEFGAIYSVKILELKENGAMVSLHPELMPVFVTNFHLDVRKIAHPSALGLTVGQKISVKYFGRDPVSGQIRLSRRALQESTGRVQDLESATSQSTELKKRVVTSNATCDDSNGDVGSNK